MEPDRPILLVEDDFQDARLSQNQLVISRTALDARVPHPYNADAPEARTSGALPQHMLGYIRVIVEIIHTSSLVMFLQKLAE